MNRNTRVFALLLLLIAAAAACGPSTTVPAVTPQESAPVPPTAEPAPRTKAPPPTAEATEVPAESTVTPMAEQGSLTLDIAGLENLGPGYAYEGWLIVDGDPVSSGVFTVDDEGQASATTFPVDPAALQSATAFVLTVEPSPDPDPAPSAVHLLGGDFTQGIAQLSIGHPAALGDDFSGAGGTFLLGIPSSDSPNDSYRSGIWFTGLSLPELPAGWIYEGWVVGPEGPMSTGRFPDGRSVDSDGAGPTAGPRPGPAFPGQDYLNPPVDLTQGYTAVISIEPDPDNSPAPFALKPLVAPITDAGDHVSQEMANNAATFPSGTAAR